MMRPVRCSSRSTSAPVALAFFSLWHCSPRACGSSGADGAAATAGGTLGYEVSDAGDRPAAG